MNETNWLGFVGDFYLNHDNTVLFSAYMLSTFKIMLRCFDLECWDQRKVKFVYMNDKIAKNAEKVRSFFLNAF